MVRTKADSAGRKASGAKAPRKGLSTPSRPSASTSFSSPKGSKNNHGAGNSACPRPTPDWQKGIGNFFPKSPCAPGKENSEPIDDEEIEEAGESSCVMESSQGSSESAGSAGSETCQDNTDIPKTGRRRAIIESDSEEDL